MTVSTPPRYSPRVLVAIPAYNEAGYIADIVIGALRYADSVIVLDDGSTDGTARIATEAGARVYNHEINKGYGAAIQSILNLSRSILPDVLVIMDSDTQHSPSDIPAVIEPILDGYDMVIGRRNSRDIPRTRRVGGRILSIATRCLSGSDIQDSQSGFRAYSRKAVEMIKPRERGMAVSSEITGLAAWAGLTITEVPISIRYTDDSSTHNLWKQGFYTLWRIMVMIARRRLGR